MRFLADERCDFSVVRALRAGGHDVLAVAEVEPAAPDETVAELAARDGRVLLTEDRDFGRLVYAAARRSGGVIFIRFPATARARLPGAVVELVDRAGDRLIGSFVVLQPGRTWIGRSPGD